MLFISIEFIIFLSIVSVLFFLVPQRLRIPYLLLVSLIFYGMNSPIYALMLLILTGIDYSIARRIDGSDSPSARKRLLILSLIINIGALLLFKYANFFNDFFANLLNLVGIHYQAVENSLLLPLGISFYTFTKIAYVVDVYRKKIQAERDPITFAAFVTFFPNVTSGPIERADHLIPQLKQSQKFDSTRIVEGLRLILWGVFKKVVIADRLAIYVDSVYGSLANNTGIRLIIAIVFFAFQIYADFSGYTDIARGAARILGIDLFENFRQPYFATSILEFWRRWHISLTTWIREYLFFPLSRALLRRTKRRYPRVIEVTTYLIIMSLIGLWHGANWTFVVWGLLHGTYMSIESVLNARRIRFMPRNRWGTRLKIAATFVLVTIAWIFFRAATINDAFYVLRNLLNFSEGLRDLVEPMSAALLGGRIEFFLSILLIIFLLVADWINASGRVVWVTRLPLVVRWGIYYAAAIFVFVSLGQRTQHFIYIQF